MKDKLEGVGSASEEMRSKSHNDSMKLVNEFKLLVKKIKDENGAKIKENKLLQDNLDDEVKLQKTEVGKTKKDKMEVKMELDVCNDKYEEIKKSHDKKSQYNDELRKQIEDMTNKMKSVEEEKQRLTAS